eukprot:gnl/Spiro4/26759_TR13292_c0_g2_i1.p1 gnl/Spiro4/26759_TR13292_c0_g2~~gnl/Spiro4/26759_TR13292_c0_g2_i1.p1  ORF type:complete len:230 (-),score=43.54 gnl/Spiro4/26759_TR13292_c0_g2_i1:520-1209(-)
MEVPFIPGCIGALCYLSALASPMPDLLRRAGCNPQLVLWYFNVVSCVACGAAFVWALALVPTIFPLSDFCVGPLDETARSWFLWWLAVRVFHLFESPLRLADGGAAVGPLHLVHHLAMFVTALVFVANPVRFFLFVGLLNSHNNFVLYLRYASAGVCNLRALVRFSAAAESVCGAAGFLLYVWEWSQHRACNREVAVLFVATVHGTLGLLRDEHHAVWRGRSSAEKPTT